MLQLQPPSSFADALLRGCVTHRPAASHALPSAQSSGFSQVVLQMPSAQRYGVQSSSMPSVPWDVFVSRHVALGSQPQGSKTFRTIHAPRLQVRRERFEPYQPGDGPRRTASCIACGFERSANQRATPHC
jgi:hypothetical protein